MKKQASFAVVLAACAALFAVPALAQGMSGGGNMKPMRATHAPMKMSHARKRPMKTARAGRMKRSCMDYAWQSQDMKDCQGGKMKPPNWR
ncbi:MAG TPA: hypothetical protein VMU87_08105 [Stellaceae bacterium]|nr:hypothetical protein [Stellaceae bacterium]